MAPQLWARAGVLGLKSGDDIDALAVFFDDDGVYDPNKDVVLISLAPGSPSLLAAGGDAGDVLQISPAGPPTVFVQGWKLGLKNSDNLDALSPIFSNQPF